MRRLMLLMSLALSAGCSTYSSIVRPAEDSLATAQRELRAERARLAKLEVDGADTPVLISRGPPRPPPAVPRRVLLVLDVEDRDGILAEADRGHLSNYLGLIAVEQRNYRVTPRGRMKERLQEQKATSLAPCVDDGCRLELGKALAAEQLLYARLLRDGERCVLGLSLYGLESETARWGRLETAACSLTELYRAADRAVAALPAGSREEARR